MPYTEVWEVTCKKQGKTPWNQGKMFRLKIKEKAEILTQKNFQKRGNQLKRELSHPCI